MSGDAHRNRQSLPAFGKKAAISLFQLLCAMTPAVAQGAYEPTSKFPLTYSTSWGQMTLQKGAGPDVSGSYPEDNGRISGTLVGTTLSGYWIESDSDVECETIRDGSRHWGRMRMEFDAGFRSFTGLWGYCNGEQERDWSGNLAGSKPVATGVRFVQEDGFGFAPIGALTYADVFFVEVDFDAAPEENEQDVALEWDGGTSEVTVFRTEDNPKLFRSELITLRPPGAVEP